MVIKYSFVVALAVLCAACEGKMGPIGPTGPTGLTGLTGPPGSANFYRITASIGSNGSAVVLLPAALGADARQPPVMTCYTGDGGNAWLAVADSWSSTSAYCGAGFSGGRWSAILHDGRPGWLAAFVVAY